MTTGDGRKTRRMWQVELAGLRALPGGIHLEGRWIYADRMQSYRAPLPAGRFRGIDRALQLEARWAWRPNLTLRLGGLHDRMGIGRSVPTWSAGQGTRVAQRIVCS
jgi:hypothetical protein